MKQEKFIIAQISDSHLFADKAGLHHGANVYQNLIKCLKKVKHINPDVIIFTGDLTQDHSETSYQNFFDAVSKVQVVCPVYYVAGNHDEHRLLAKYLVGEYYCTEKVIEWQQWQILLVDSKSETPAGFINQQALENIQNDSDDNKSQLLFMHHHPVDVGYFIDRHGLTNQAELWALIDGKPSIKAIACGHVHNDLEMVKGHVKVFTCPATSIQFLPDPNELVNANRAAGFRTFELSISGQVTSQVHFV